MVSITPNSTTFVPPTVCLPFNKTSNYNGMFSKQDPLDFIVPTTMLQMFLSVTISQILYFILSPLKQSKLVCNILAGVILGPSVLGRNKTYLKKMFGPKETVVIATMSNLSVFLYAFITWIKVDPSMLTRAAKNTWKLALCCLVFPFTLTACLTFWVRHLPIPIRINVVSSLSYFIVITRALDELNLLSSELGQISSSITCVHELVCWVYVAVTVAIGQNETKHSVYAILCLFSLVMFAIFVIRPILFRIIKTTPKGKPVSEGYVIAIILSAFVMGLMTDAIGANFFLASVIMGGVIPDGPPLGATIVRKCELVLSEVLLPFFFIRIGLFTDLSTVFNDYNEIVTFVAMFFAGFLGRLIACLLFSSTMNMKKSNATFLSLVLSLEGVVELLQTNNWRHTQLLDVRSFSLSVVFITTVNVIVNPILAVYYNPVVENFDSPSFVRLRNSSLRSTPLVEDLRIIACIQDEDNVPSIISLLEALNPKGLSTIRAYVVHLVAVTSETVPTLAPYKNHLRGFRHASGSDSIVRAFLNYAGHSPSPVQIHPYRMISQYKYMHQHICRLGENVDAPLIVVPFFKREEAHVTDGTLRILDTNIQAVANCTVGLLVDRGLRSLSSLTTFSYNMAVLFLGGEDDREAIALASRASRQPNVRITMLRIEMSGDHDTFDARIEREADNTLFREFKAMNVNNGSVVCDEIVTRDVEDIMKAIRSLSKAYDIVVVGKRHSIPELEALESWVQYPELGVIGDAIAAPDCIGEKLSVLVLQHRAHKNQSV